MFFIGFNRKWTSPQPRQRKLAVFGSLFYTCMLVQTQLPVSFGKHIRFCFHQDVKVIAIMTTAIFSFNIVFTGAKKERKWKPPWTWIEVKWKQDAAVATGLTRFSISVSPTDGRKWRMKLPETFVLFMWKPSAASPESFASGSSLFLSAHYGAIVFGKSENVRLYFDFSPTMLLGRCFNATAGNHTKSWLVTQLISTHRSSGQSQYRMQGFTIQVNQTETTRCCFCVSRVSLFTICARCQQYTVFFATQTMDFVTIQHVVVFIFPLFHCVTLLLFKTMTLDKLNSGPADLHSYIFTVCLFPRLLLIRTGLQLKPGTSMPVQCWSHCSRSPCGWKINAFSLNIFPQIHHSHHLINTLHSYQLQVFLWQDTK